MKLLIVTCLKENQEEVFKIFKKAGIHVFSATDVIGFKDTSDLNLLEEWFASGDERFDSRLLFSFTTAENAGHGMELINKFNGESGSGFPVRAFIVPVEQSNLNL